MKGKMFPNLSEEELREALLKAMDFAWDFKHQRDRRVMEEAENHGKRADDFVDYLTSEERELNRRYVMWAMDVMNPKSKEER